MDQKLTDRLVSLDPAGLQSATQHPFLKQAGEDSFPEKALFEWLAQDRLYAISYVSFISQLLSKISIPTTSDRQETLEWRIASCLIDCLTNIRTEISLFEENANRKGWTQTMGEARPNLATQAYRDIFAGASQPSSSLLKGMVVLWATEKCYLMSWRYAAQCLENSGGAKKDNILHEVFIPNWSSKEFEEFVDVLAKLVDEMGPRATSQDIIEAEESWKQILWAEFQFWPRF
jgi:thiaminase